MEHSLEESDIDLIPEMPGQLEDPGPVPVDDSAASAPSQPQGSVLPLRREEAIAKLAVERSFLPLVPQQDPSPRASSAPPAHEHPARLDAGRYESSESESSDSEPNPDSPAFIRLALHRTIDSEELASLESFTGQWRGPQGFPAGRIQHGCILFCHPAVVPGLARLHMGPFQTCFTVMLERPTALASAKIVHEAEGADKLFWSDGTVWWRPRIQKEETHVREITYREASALRKHEQPQSPSVLIETMHNFVDKYRSPAPATGPHQ